MSESFDSYNAPQFFDFSKDLQREDDSDTYFEVDHERHVESVDSFKYQNTTEDSAECINLFSTTDQTKDILEDPLKIRDSEETLVEETSTQHSSTDFTEVLDSDEEATGRAKLRRSMSAGNLYLNKAVFNPKPKLIANLSDDVKQLHLSETQHVSRNKSINDLVKESSKTILSKNKIVPTQPSVPHLTRAASKENINRLSQPKRHYGSAQNLNQCDYVSTAEAVRKFQSGTPVRFRSKPKLENMDGVNKPVRTIPQSPPLMTKNRHRQVMALSREEKERLEYEEAQKFKIKAHPLNKKILQGPLKPIPIEKKPTTIPEPFNITAITKKVPESPKKVFEFHAKPVPKTLHEVPQLKEVQKISITKPLTPTFMKRYPKEPEKTKQTEENKPLFLPTKTTPIPFSFEKRDKYLQKKKQELIKKVLEEEKKAREFHARPVPKAVLNPSKSLQRLNSLDNIHKPQITKSDENLSCQFKARPPTVLYKKPFEPKKDENHLIEITEFQLNTEMRAKEREEFEQLKKEKEERITLAKKREEEIMLQIEDEEIARLRKQTEYKAQPIKKYKEVKIQPSGLVTEPKSPKFHTNKYRNKENKENSAEN